MLATCLLAALAWAACGDPGGARDAGADGASDAEGAGSRAAGPSGAMAARPDDPEVEPVRLARAALASADIPLYPGAGGLDATEFEANTAPFVAAEFFTVDAPDRVAAYYDRELRARTRRRNTTLQPGVVRYEFERAFSGLAVEPWEPEGADREAMLERFDRRDAQGVTSADLDAYGELLAAARTQVVVNLPRPEPR
ncbi:MAG TPA: hypothetical protein VIC56_09545 [Gemmatimonadota bacterium]